MGNRFSAAIALAAGLFAAACGSGNTNTGSAPAGQANTFDGTYQVRLNPTQFGCMPGDAEVQITGIDLTGTGSINSGTQLTAIELSVAGSLSFSSGESTAILAATGAGNGPSSYSIRLSGSATRTANGATLGGSYTDSLGCDGNWLSV